MCNCYVRFLGAEARFCLRFGAHGLACLVYRPSGDPVDRQADEEFRAENEPVVSTPPNRWGLR